MFLKRSIGGHHVLVRVALGIALAIVLAIVVLLVVALARRAFAPARVSLAPPVHAARHGLQCNGSAGSAAPETLAAQSSRT